MGWFGMSSNDDENWEGDFNKLWNQIDDNDLVSLFDCHI